MSLKIVIADDEALARERLKTQIADIGGYEVVGEAANGLEALEWVQTQQPEIILLDIRMPAMDGIETARHLSSFENPPAIIFTTAYDQHVLAAFETNASDYLLKPIRQERLAHALSKAKKLNRAQLTRLQTSSPTPAARSHLCVRQRGSLQLVAVNEVYYFHADQKYVTVRYADGELLLEESLRALEQEFSSVFVRVHRSTLVAMPYIEGLEKTADGRHLVCFKGVADQVEISRRHLALVRQLIKNRG